MTSSLLTCWTQRRPLTSRALPDEHVRRAEPLATDGRRRRGLAAADRRPRPAAVAAEAVERDVDGLAGADGDAQRARARVCSDDVADHVRRVPGSGRGGAGDVAGRAGVVEMQSRVTDGRRRVYDCRPKTANKQPIN